MTNKQAILQLENLREHCNSFRAVEGIWEADMEAIDLAIKALTAKVGNKRWRAKTKELYWYIDDYGLLNSSAECNMRSDDYHYNSRNYFKAKEEAEKYAEVLESETLLKKFADEHNHKLIDWNDAHQDKFSLKYSSGDKTIFIDIACHTRDARTIYFDSREVARQAVEEIGESRITEYLTYEW